MTLHRGIPVTLARGGASRGVFVHARDLEGVARDHWPRLFAGWLGSPDPTGRQLDGMGGGNPSTSKTVVLVPSGDPDYDIDYTFFQFDPRTGEPETGGVCGNLTSAAGLLAVRDGLVATTAPRTLVRLKDANTSQRIDVEVPLTAVATLPDAPAAPASERGIRSTFHAPLGMLSGRTYPAGELPDRTLIEAVNPLVLLDADALGIDANTPPDELEGDRELMAAFEQARREGAVSFGLASDVDAAAHESGFYPFIGAWASPRDYRALSGEIVRAEDVDCVIRMLSGGTVHRALPLSAGLATACAVYLRQGGVAGTRIVRLGHPSGILAVEISGDPAAERIDTVSVEQTARVILTGFAESD